MCWEELSRAGPCPSSLDALDSALLYCPQVEAGMQAIPGEDWRASSSSLNLGVEVHRPGLFRYRCCEVAYTLRPVFFSVVGWSQVHETRDWKAGEVRLHCLWEATSDPAPASGCQANSPEGSDTAGNSAFGHHARQSRSSRTVPCLLLCLTM